MSENRRGGFFYSHCIYSYRSWATVFAAIVHSNVHAVIEMRKYVYSVEVDVLLVGLCQWNAGFHQSDWQQSSRRPLRCII